MCLINRAHLAQTQTGKHAQIYGQTDTEKQTNTDRQTDRQTLGLSSEVDKVYYTSLVANYS